MAFASLPTGCKREHALHLDRLQDGSRREVNLIPNAQIEDQLFNQLADKKVDVVTCRSGWVQNYCRMCRHFGSPLTF